MVYPERAQKAGVVLVIHDIRGMSDMARAMGDQLAQDGFIAVVPDFLSGKGPNGGGTESLGAEVGKTIQSLTPADVVARLNAAMDYGKKLPASNGKTGVIGFCWGGARSFGYAAAQPALNAAVVYYGDAPGSADSTQETTLANVKAPVLGLYAGNDARINATLPATEAAMKKLGKSYELHTYEGAGHGFMFSQAGAGGANLKAAQESWPVVLQFFRKNLPKNELSHQTTVSCPSVCPLPSLSWRPGVQTRPLTSRLPHWRRLLSITGRARPLPALIRSFFTMNWAVNRPLDAD